MSGVDPQGLPAIPLLPGDGIGPVVLAEAVRVLQAVCLPRALETHAFGLDAWRQTGDALPAATEAAIRRAGVALLGAATTPEQGCRSPILQLRDRLGLDLLVRPVRHGGLDLVVVGAASAGLYAETEDPGPPAVVRRVVHPSAVQALLAEAARHARRRITVVDKPTVLRGSARIFREAGERLAREDLVFEVINADAFVAALVRRPGDFDGVVGLSFVADVVSDLAAALAGGKGTTASVSLSSVRGGGCAVFEPVHGSAPRRAGDDPATVNPEGAIRAAALMLQHLGHGRRAACVEEALGEVADRLTTPDRGGDATTPQVGAAVAAAAARRWRGQG